MGFECQCDEGYEISDMGECEEICDEDQCAAGGITINGIFYGLPGGKVCPDGMTCENMCKGYRCNCPEGEKNVDGQCVPDCDENQCSTGTHNCGQNSYCEDACTEFTCECEDGYEMNDQSECVEICDENQCSSEPCGENQICLDKCQSYECQCLDGFEINENSECVEICDENQCANNPCGENQICTDLCQSYDFEIFPRKKLPLNLNFYN